MGRSRRIALAPRAARRARVLAPALALLVLSAPASAQPATTTFTDVTAAAGLDYGPSLLASTLQRCIDRAGEVSGPASDDPVLAYCNIMADSGGATVGDYNGDGLPDLYVLRYDRPALLFENQGDGTFVEVAAEVGVDLAGQVDFAKDQSVGGAVFGDIDNDGDEDLYVLTQHTEHFLLFINDGGRHGPHGRPRFTEEALARGAGVPGDVAARRGGESPAIGDYDRDGWLDLFTTEWSVGATSCDLWRQRLLHNRGAGSPAAPGYFEDVTLRAGVILTDRDHSGPFGFSPAFVDLDGDGWPDLAVASDYGTSRLFWNDRRGGFIDAAAPVVAGGGGGWRPTEPTQAQGMGTAFGDYDNDGDLDWFMTSILAPAERLDGNRLYRNTGARFFDSVASEAGVSDGGWAWGTAFFDMDNDGDLDLVVTNGFPSYGLDDKPTRLFENLGDGTFREVGALAGFHDSVQGRTVVAFDYDGDGDLDLFIGRLGEVGGTLYRNDLNTPGAPPAADYLRVRVQGRVSNRDGRGARVRVTPSDGGTTQVREIGATSHFGGESERVAHFGLGAGFSAAARTVDVDVVFLSGLEVHERGVAPDQVLTVVEPDAASLVTPPPVPGPAQDCDGDGQPDSCAPDCNGNGRPDACDLADHVDTDCNANGVPDACDLAAFLLLDCNTNGEADLCEIQCHPALDADGDGVIDYCVTGCDETGHCPGVDPDHPECVSAPDAGVPDAGMPDAGMPDAGVRDAGVDGGVPDAGHADGGNPGARDGGGCALAPAAARSAGAPWLVLAAAMCGFALRRRSRGER